MIEAAPKLDAACGQMEHLDEGTLGVIAQSLAGIFMACFGVSHEIGGGSFEDAVRVMVTPKAQAETVEGD